MQKADLVLYHGIEIHTWQNSVSQSSTELNCADKTMKIIYFLFLHGGNAPVAPPSQ